MVVFDLFSCFLGTDSHICAVFSLKKQDVILKHKALFYKTLNYQALTPLLPYRNGWIKIYAISKKSLENNSLPSNIQQRKSKKVKSLRNQRLRLKVF